jgi:hypothetical protein
MRVHKKIAEDRLLKVVGLIVKNKNHNPDFLYSYCDFDITKSGFYKVVNRAIRLIEEYENSIHPYSPLDKNTEQSVPSRYTVTIDAQNFERLLSSTKEAKEIVDGKKEPNKQFFAEELVIEQVKKETHIETKPVIGISDLLEPEDRPVLETEAEVVKSIEGEQESLQIEIPRLTVEKFLERRYKAIPEDACKIIQGYKLITDFKFMPQDVNIFNSKDIDVVILESVRVKELTDYMYGVYEIEDDVETERELEKIGVVINRDCIKGFCSASSVLDQFEFKKIARNRYVADGKFIDKFVINREWRKGSATRKYIEIELEEIKKDYSQRLKKSEDEVDFLITEALKEWSFPFENVQTRGMIGDNDSRIDYREYDRELKMIPFAPTLDEFKKMYKEDILEYFNNISVSMMEMFAKWSLIGNEPHPIIEEILKKLGMTRQQLTISLREQYNKEKLKEVENYKIGKLMNSLCSQKESIVKYNISIDDSKLEFVKNFLNATK